MQPLFGRQKKIITEKKRLKEEEKGKESKKEDHKTVNQKQRWILMRPMIRQV